MKAQSHVDAGICGFKTDLTAESLAEMGMVRISINTDCPNLLKLESSFDFNVLEVTKNGCDTDIFKKFSQITPPMCCPCPVLTALYQVGKIASGLALPKDITISLSKDS